MLENYYWFIDLRDIEAIIGIVVLGFGLGFWLGSKLR